MWRANAKTRTSPAFLNAMVSNAALMAAADCAARGASPPSPACKVNAKKTKVRVFPIAAAGFAEPMVAVTSAEPVQGNNPIVNLAFAKPSA